ncbi:Repressor of the inhibitor of the protein kinase-like protein [Heracleum sosnowskyi]|uniref:Repressor of the inhibitor of the protein kinase-like protein n=1 Tax=Heracleum sosnowskyi TaxID=360622 RepID=A0AAD8MXR1_9APIA|nr:Repressor of the inhibitor of the protein kinase-like protein [Heracleum sosnowskyi]
MEGDGVENGHCILNVEERVQGRTSGWAEVGSSPGQSPADPKACHQFFHGSSSNLHSSSTNIKYKMSQDKKRKTLFSYFSSGMATPTPSDCTPTHTPSATPTATSSGTATPIATPTATSSGTATPSDTPTFDLASLERDPGLRRPIWKYPPNVRDDIRREYIRLGPCQPQLRRDQYPATEFGTQRRRFQASWFNTFKWLEYSVSKDAAFCFPCYLFESDASSQHAFTIDGFKSWKRVNDNERCAFLVHIGTSNSPHKKAIKDYEGLQNVTRHIDKVINCQSLEEVKKNRLRLRATIEGVRYLSLQACALRGHDESSTSRNRGNLIEIVKTFGRVSPDISNVILENAPKNATYTSPKVQKDILHIFASKVRNIIRNEIRDSKFCILVDEALDASQKEQMAIVLRFVDVYGVIRERFFDIVNVFDTTSLTLKKELSDVLTRNNLNIQNMRGQGYDGASNMRGAFNGLQALFLRDCPYAYYVHCFAHRLQLALVGAAEKQDYVWEFFSMLANVVNIVSGSSKRLSELQTAHGIEVDHSVASGERETGRGLNQIGNLQRAGSTRWSSHFNSVCSLIDKYGSIIVVLESINNCTTNSSAQRGEARGTIKAVKSFKFLFVLYLMHKIMGITDLLCRALQSKSIDILNAMDLVATTKELLQSLRDDGFDVLLHYVILERRAKAAVMDSHLSLVNQLLFLDVVGQKRSRNGSDDVEASAKHQKLDLASGSITDTRSAQTIDTSLIQVPDAAPIDVVIEILEALELPLNKNGVPPMKNREESGMAPAGPSGNDNTLDIANKMRMVVSNSVGALGTNNDMKSGPRPLPLFIGRGQRYWRTVSTNAKEDTEDLVDAAVGKEEKSGVSGADMVVAAAWGHNGDALSGGHLGDADGDTAGDARYSHDSC